MQTAKNIKSLRQNPNTQMQFPDKLFLFLRGKYSQSRGYNPRRLLLLHI